MGPPNAPSKRWLIAIHERMSDPEALASQLDVSLSTLKRWLGGEPVHPKHHPVIDELAYRLFTKEDLDHPSVKTRVAERDRLEHERREKPHPLRFSNPRDRAEPSFVPLLRSLLVDEKYAELHDWGMEFYRHRRGEIEALLPVLRKKLLNWIVLACWKTGRYEAGVDVAQDALNGASDGPCPDDEQLQEEDMKVTAALLCNNGILEMRRGNLPIARRLLEESKRLSKGLPTYWNDIVLIYLEEKDPKKAEARAAKSAEILRDLIAETEDPNRYLKELLKDRDLRRFKRTPSFERVFGAVRTQAKRASTTAASVAVALALASTSLLAGSWDDHRVAAVEENTTALVAASEVQDCEAPSVGCESAVRGYVPTASRPMLDLVARFSAPSEWPRTSLAPHFPSALPDDVRPFRVERCIMGDAPL